MEYGSMACGIMGGMGVREQDVEYMLWVHETMCGSAQVLANIMGTRDMERWFGGSHCPKYLRVHVTQPDPWWSHLLIPGGSSCPQTDKKG